MIRPYLSVIRDSFRAAMSSRVLYIVLALIGLVLLALAPFHVRQSLDWKLTQGDGISAPDRLFARLVEDGKSGDRAAVAHIWNRLSADMQEDLEEVVASPEKNRQAEGAPGGIITNRLVSEFNRLMEDGSLYDADAFTGKRLNEETEGLIEKGAQRTSIEDRRLNRLLLSTALGRDVMPRPRATQLDFYYFHWHWKVFTTNISHSEFASGLTSLLPTYFDKFIMSIGIFIAILITASIIPEMLEPGSLNLLLSKPVHRWGLLLAKYIGGCVFILLCATLLFVGLWLWMGIQLGVWERALLMSIPTYVFVFAMYYAVSVLAGIWFRSPILCVVFAVLFWAVCFAVGSAYSWLDYWHYNMSAREMVATGDDVVMVDMLQTHRIWDPTEEAWVTPSNREASPDEAGLGFAAVFDRMDEFPDMPGPVVDREQQRILIADNSIFDALSNAQLDLASIDPEKHRISGNRGQLPSGTIQVLYSTTLGQLAVDQNGSIFKWTGEEVAEETAEPEADESEDPSEPAASTKLSDQISGMFKTAQGGRQYEKISGDWSFSIQNSHGVCLNPANDEIALYSEGKLVLLRPDEEGNYQLHLQESVGGHTNDRMTAFVSCRSNHIFLMLGNGRFFDIDPADLSTRHTEDLSGLAAVRSLTAAPDGRFAALTLRSGQLWIYDSSSRAEYSGFSVGRHDIMACRFDEQGRLWIGDRFQSARCYELDSGEEVLARVPGSNWFTTAFRYVIRPLYRIFPKPGEFYKVVARLSSSSDAGDNPDIDLTRLPHRDDPWLPLKSGVLFTVLLLAFSCFVFQRQDF